MVRVLLKVGAILSPPPPVDSLQPIVLRPGDYSITAEPGTFSRRSRRSKTASTQPLRPLRVLSKLSSSHLSVSVR